MTLKRDYCIAFINSLDNIDTSNYNFVQNLMHYWVKELEGVVKVKTFTFYESALIFGRDYGYEHLIIVDIGNDLEVNGRFIEKLDKFLRDDDALVGHILDKKDRYYELHNQCFYINTRIWKELGSPDIGHSADIKEYMLPTRSSENYHDDYTPYFIRPGSKMQTFKNLKFGHNLINEYLNAGYTIRSFDESVRSSKIYGYPREKQNKLKQIHDFNVQKKFYMFNTENVSFDKLPKNIEKFATVSSGLNHLRILYKRGMSNNLEMCFFDWDEFSLNLMQEIYTNWDGYDYPNFLKTISSKLKYNGKIVATSDVKWNEFLETFGTEDKFAEWFNKLKKHVKVRYLKIDILKDDLNSLTSFFDKDTNNLLWLSNIFHYKPTSLFYSTLDRAIVQDRLVEMLPKKIVVFADSATLNQSKIFTPETYIKQTENAAKFIKGNLS